ncbi:toll/interleukin-1 receptor domain-containing protein [Candidatus Uabimicrobium amorphum]|uniref:TIR domain-containing protein n=1 Tax=Uabimicrobium amorphum TaxID=2596890 RepID=A0A5S9IQW0_UABAM|nr:toll/interleukin-1 receptor domain-containing protein [Candidatus Uabimicrobium amorphum]BBM85792.1 hypothetical protein UABAM_04170 [Candidatus Uabimicrobium amorphum]
MQLINNIAVYHNSEPRFIELHKGDLSQIPDKDAVDILVVSSFPGDYNEVPGTLIGALSDQGVSVGKLAKDKESDLRDTFSCWLSKEVENKGVNFKKILCFEPRKREQHVPEVIGDIFQSLIAFLSNSESLQDVAMPLVATGSQRASKNEILTALVEAAAHWLGMGLPVKRIKIAIYNQSSVDEAMDVFSQLKEKYHQQAPLKEKSKDDSYQYDIFISYSHQNTAEANHLVSLLKELDDKLRIFIDRKELDVGCAWQQQIYDALDSCRKVVALYSTDYLNSKVCKEEFNIALYRDRDREENVLFPIYLYSAALPTYMKVLQYIDCREGDQNKLRVACKKIISDESSQKLSGVTTTQSSNKDDVYSLIRELQAQMSTTTDKLNDMQHKLDKLYKRVFDSE